MSQTPRTLFSPRYTRFLDELFAQITTKKTGAATPRGTLSERHVAHSLSATCCARLRSAEQSGLAAAASPCRTNSRALPRYRRALTIPAPSMCFRQHRQHRRFSTLFDARTIDLPHACSAAGHTPLSEEALCGPGMMPGMITGLPDSLEADVRARARVQVSSVCDAQGRAMLPGVKLIHVFDQGAREPFSSPHHSQVRHLLCLHAFRFTAHLACHEQPHHAGQQKICSMRRDQYDEHALT